MNQDYFAVVYKAISDLLNQNASLLESMGMNLFMAFAAILIVWWGLQSALTSAAGGGGFSWPNFVGLMQELLLCYVMLAFYTAPIPGLGISFTHVILDEAQTLTATLNQTSTQSVLETLNALETNLPFPSPFDILAVVQFALLSLAIISAQAFTLAVTMYGYVATAVIILLGPIFIPFKMVPQMEWMFWGWFRAFIQYAFYQLVASAYVFIFGQFLTQILGAKTGPIASQDLGYLMGPIILALITFVLGLIKVPALVFSIFSGRSGDYVLPRWG